MYRDYETERNDMVERQLIPRGITSPTVLDAMRNVPRHLFIPEDMRSSAYADSPLPIGAGQTISQPYIVAYMTEQLEPIQGMKVLEIGTGSGYQAAILDYLGCKVYTIELLKEHAERTSKLLAEQGCENVFVRNGNGYKGWPEEAPFDAIIVTAAPDSIPSALIEQLKEDGNMIIPVGEAHAVQSLKRLTKKSDGYITKELLLVRFVPMVDKIS
ncbi:MAG: protein-L-isoaspartate(D-aspartate) O-methyltransferase [Oscillospiraceae bacterium]|nr:protein-L-isoaspartate(D-aspartate) O-methyltransferase [Oscillospiraceae bacterium]